MPSYVIDSNILIYHLKEEPAITQFLEDLLTENDHAFVSAITRTEVLAAPVMQEGEDQRIIILLNKFHTIPVDLYIADTAARIRRMYRLTLGDSIIAATAFMFNSTLVTRNVRDFKKVPELQILPL